MFAEIIRFFASCGLEGLTLLVSDNGVGVKGKIKEGFGLKGIREKAEKLQVVTRFDGSAVNRLGDNFLYLFF